MKLVNPPDLPVGDITAQMLEPRPLPIGRQQFEEWSDRIIAGALVEADTRSQKWALANMLIHLGATESHKPDAFFVHSLRKAAINQTADAIRREYKAEADAKAAEKIDSKDEHVN